MKKKLYIFMFLLLCYSCQEKNNYRLQIKDALNSRLQFEDCHLLNNSNILVPFDIISESFNYLSIVYLQEDCNQCTERLNRWLYELNNFKFPEYYSIVFIVENLDFAMGIKQNISENMASNKIYLLVDNKQQFFNNNSHISVHVAESSIFINNKGKVLLIGEPYSNDRIKKLFHKKVNM